MKLNTIVSDSIDYVAFKIFSRAKYYQDLGKINRENIKQELPKLYSNLGSHKDFIRENLEVYENSAYLDVQGQTSLINMDVVGLDLGSLMPKAKKASLSLGLTWYAIKLIDNYVDKNDLGESAFEDFIGKTYDSWMSNKIISRNKPLESKLIESTTALLNSNFVCEPKTYKNELFEVSVSEQVFKYGLKKDKLTNAEDVGLKSANLSIAILQHYIPDFPNEKEAFIQEQGMAAKLFDDIKDLKIDRLQGDGYGSGALVPLTGNFFKHFFKHYGALDFNGSWRNTNFLVLASLFHLKELLGVKERS